MSIFGRQYRDSEELSPSWSIRSKSDPRWNFGGFCYGMWDAMDRQKKHIEKLRQTLGEPPADLEVAYSKPCTPLN